MSRSLLTLIFVTTLLFAGCAPATYPPNLRALGDAELRVRIKTALLNAPEIDATRVDVHASEGAVTLQGEVPTDDQVRKVVELVRQVAGVVDVESKMSVAARPAAIPRALRPPTARF